MLREMMLCRAVTICALASRASLPTCGMAAWQPVPSITSLKRLLDAITAPVRRPMLPAGSPGQLCTPNTASTAKRSNRPSLIISAAPAPPSSAGWKMNCTMPSKLRCLDR